MSDFGSDVGQNTIQIGANVFIRLTELLANLVKSMIQSVAEHNSPEFKVAREKLREMKDERSKREYVQSLENMCGYVEHSKLIKAGVPLSNIGLDGKVTDEEFCQIREICERNGVILSGVKMKGSAILNENSSWLLECRTSDVERFKDCINMFNKERRVDEINADLLRYSDKGIEKLSQKERLDRAGLIEEKDSIIHGYRNDMNDEQISSVVYKAAGIEPRKCADFAEALNRNTGRQLNHDITFIVADMADPAKHVRCHGYMDRFNGKNYIKTDYEVYYGDKLLMKADDGRFSGRPRDYWVTQRESMRTTGGFNGELLRFDSMADYQAFMNDVVLENESELGFINAGHSNRDYTDIIDKLENHLDSNGYEALINTTKDQLNDKELITVSVANKETGEALHINPDLPMSVEKKIKAECLIIGNQLALYHQMHKLTDDMTISKAESKLYADNSPAKMAAESAYNAQRSAYEDLKSIENNLLEQRRQINSAQVEFNHRNAKQILKEQQQDRVTDTGHDMAGYEERVAELDNRPLDMSEWMDNIISERETVNQRGVNDSNIQSFPERAAIKKNTPDLNNR